MKLGEDEVDMLRFHMHQESGQLELRRKRYEVAKLGFPKPPAWALINWTFVQYFDDFGSYRSPIEMIQILLETRLPEFSNDYKNIKLEDQMQSGESPELHADVGARG